MILLKNKPKTSIYLYEQIAMDITSKINNQTYKVGDKLPNEYALCEIYDTSRITVRRALKELANQNMIEIKHGNGTFIKKDNRRIHLIPLHGFTDGMRIARDNVQKQVLSKRVIDATQHLKKVFEREEDFQLIRLKRKISDDEKTVSIDVSYFPLDDYPGLLNKIDDDVSTYSLLRNEYGIEFSQAKKEIDLIYPDLKLRNFFDSTLVGPLYKVNKVVLNPEEKPVHYSRYYLDPSSVKITIETDVD